jgi:hypothetical protein
MAQNGWLGYLLAHGWSDSFAGQYDSGILRFYLCCSVSKFVRMLLIVWGNGLQKIVHDS